MTDLCSTCGHTEADHKSNRAPFPHPVVYGVCLRRDCECRAFTSLADDLEKVSKAALTRHEE